MVTNLHDLLTRYRLTVPYLVCVLYVAYVVTLFQVAGYP